MCIHLNYQVLKALEFEFEFRASHLLGRLSYHLSYSVNPSFVLSILEIRSLTIYPWLALNLHLPDLCLLSS
jgi:hypothetical protein